MPRSKMLLSSRVRESGPANSPARPPYKHHEPRDDKEREGDDDGENHSGVDVGISAVVQCNASRTTSHRTLVVASRPFVRFDHALDFAVSHGEPE